MKTVLLYSLALLFGITSFSQSKKKIQKAWIKTAIENLSNSKTSSDTFYMRYTFDKAKLYISFYPAWNDYEQTWSINGNLLTLGFDTYIIEELTDSSLVIFFEGFRRMRFLSEEYLSSQEVNLVLQGEYNGKPLYKANKYITPRYSKNTSLKNIQIKAEERYRVKKATYFSATFIVTEEGKIENIKIINGITNSFDEEMTTQLMKTSKDWKPAYYKGKPIQTQMLYEIKYLDSISR